jgi:peroxiredoxin family protein
MSMVLICRDALEDSVLGNLALARLVARRGGEAVVVFVGEALKALDTGTFRWSQNFKTRDARIEIIAAAEEAGLALGHRELDHRWSDVRSLVRSAVEQPGVRLVACPLWGSLLGLSEELDFLERIDDAQLVELLESADSIVGGY